MKKLVYIPLLALLAACGGADEPAVGSNDLVALKAKKDSLTTELNMVRAQIAALDTTEEITLPLVETETVKRELFEHYVEVQGNVEAEKNAVLYAEAGGNVRTIHVQEGQKVSKGQRLVTFDTDVISRNIAEMEKRLELATFAYERQANLWEQKIGSEIQYEQAKNQKESLEKSISTLRAQQSKAIISAPFAGTIDEIMPNPGEMVPPGMPVLRLVNLDKISIEAQVAENYLGSVKAGTKVEIELPALKDASGNRVILTNQQLSSAGKFINPNNRTFKVRLNLVNDKELFVPNLLALVRIQDFVMPNAVVIPEKYVRQNSSQENYVFVMEEKDGIETAKMVKVEIAADKAYKMPHQQHNMVVVTSGLNGGEKLITEGNRGVQDGQQVKVKSK